MDIVPKDEMLVIETEIMPNLIDRLRSMITLILDSLIPQGLSFSCFGEGHIDFH